MVAAIDSKSIAVWRAGSIPAVGTKANAKRPGAFPEIKNKKYYDNLHYFNNHVRHGN